MSLLDDATLLKMAEAEILGEAKRAATRHSTAGISGWQPGPKTNKTFLTNTLLQTMASNRILTKKAGVKGENKKILKRSERKLLQKKSKSDIETNFVYIKPRKINENSTFSSKTSKLNDNKITLHDGQLKSSPENKKKCNVKKIKLKKI